MAISKKAQEAKEAAVLMRRWQIHPKVWVEHMFGLKHQPVRPEHETDMRTCIQTQDWLSVNPEWFEPFIKGKHFTWQQWCILEAVAAANKGIAPDRISISSGHGIGKSTTCAWLVLWGLMCHADSRIGCTAPSREQMHDVLWSEAKKWIEKMPEGFQSVYEWQGGYIRMKDNPEHWWARARTAKKESPEAFAGLHADYVLCLADEASGVHNKIFETMEGALTGEDKLIIMISNPTRLTGYFYDSFYNDKSSWQRLQFSCLDSPVVDNAYVNRILEKYGDQSDEWRVRVLGQFPSAEAMDDKGFLPLLNLDKITFTIDHEFGKNKKIMGIDPSGEGQDEMVWVIRDAMKAKVVHKERDVTEASAVQKTLTLMQHYGIKAEDVNVDLFGIGAKFCQRMAKAGSVVNGVNVGDKLSKNEDEEERKKFLNKRAQAYWRLKNWLAGGGEIVSNDDIRDEVPNIRYTRAVTGAIAIMPKKLMKKEGIPSPNHMDALMLTFCDPEEALFNEFEDMLDDDDLMDDDIYAGPFG